MEEIIIKTDKVIFQWFKHKHYKPHIKAGDLIIDLHAKGEGRNRSFKEVIKIWERELIPEAWK